MNPTLWGPSRAFDCNSCGVPIRVDQSLLQLAQTHLADESPTQSTEMCWHCGSPFSYSQLSGALHSAALPPDVVEVDLRSATPCKVGDILLIDKNGIQVKRLLGKPGQTISLDDSDRLLIDGQRPRFDSPPRVAVDSDRSRHSSRWHGHGESSRWQRQADRIWTAHGDTDWLVYTHQNVYRGPRPGRILDDYPGNLGVERALFPADGISICFELAVPSALDGRDVECSVAFRTERGIEMHQRIVRADSKFPAKIEVPSQQASPGSQPRSEGTEPTNPLANMLSPQRPIAIKLSRLREKTVTLGALSVCREVLYRISSIGPRRGVADKYRPPSYPMLLGDNEWFVIGDNVPLSIDSRYWGAVIGDEIIGRVEEIS